MSRSIRLRDAARGVGRNGVPNRLSREGGVARTLAPRQEATVRPRGRGSQAKAQNQRARDPQAPAGRCPNARPSQRRSPRPGRSRSTFYTWGAVALVMLVIVVLVVVSSTSSKTKAMLYNAAPVPAPVLREVTRVPASVYNAVGTGIAGAIVPPRIETGQKALTFTRKPGVFGLFGEFCPYCAAERWAIITSFSRFGTFAGLETMQSSPVDVDPKTQTFTFKTATFISSYFTAKLVEYFGQDKPTGRHTVIGKLTKQEASLVEKYDHTTTTMSVPFMDMGNKMISEGVSFTPGVLKGLARTTVASLLSNPNNDITKLIIGTSNYMSAGICTIDGGKPGSVCSSAGVQAAAEALKLNV